MDDANYIALLANIPAQAESLLLSLDQAEGGIYLHVNAEKMEYICFNQSGDISTLNGSSLRLGDKFTYLGSSVSSTENDISTRLSKAWIVIDRLLVIWKWNLSDRIKQFFQTAVMSILRYGCTTLALTQCIEKKLDGNCASNVKQILEATPHKTAAVWPPTTYLEDHPN